MSLPTRIRVYLVVDLKEAKVVFATHDAQLAVLVKQANVEQGRVIDLVPIVSMRRIHADGLTEHRCFACPTPHTVSWESTTEWSSRMFETPCEGAAGRAQQFQLENAWRLN